MKKLKVGIVVGGFAPYGTGGGIASYTLELAKSLLMRGHFVQVFSVIINDSLDVEDIYTYEGISVRIIKGVPVNGLRPDMAVDENSKRVSLCVNDYLKESELDLLEVPDIGAYGLHIDTNKLPLLVRLHTASLELAELKPLGRFDPRVYLIHKLESKAIHNATLVSALTNYQARKAKKIYGIGEDIVRVIPNFLKDSNNEKSYDDSIVKFIFVGTLEKRKGIDLICKAFKLVSKEYDNFELLFAGPDKQQRFGLVRKSTIKYCKDKLNNSPFDVSFTGKLSREKILQLLRDSHVLILPSRYEAFPMVIIEAMEKSLGIISSDACGIPEIVKDDVNGFIFKSNNFESLSISISKVLDDSSRIVEFGKNNRNKYLNCYSESVVLPEIENCYRELVG